MTGREPKQPPLQNIPIRTELGKRIRAAFIQGEPVLYCDYASLEQAIITRARAQQQPGENRD